MLNGFFMNEIERMNGIERINGFLKRKLIDRIPVYEHFWNDTLKIWTEQGHITAGENLPAHFGFDICQSGWYNMTADVHFQPKIIDETEDTVTTLDGNGAILKRHKKHDSTPEHIGFTCKTPDDWYGTYKPMVESVNDRIWTAAYKEAKKAAADTGRFFALSSSHAFALMKDVIGHETMLAAMALEPEWITDMAMTYAKLHVALQEEIIAEIGKPDGIWYYEDMGFKERPFMSPAMYDEIFKPAHKLTFDFAKSLGIPIILHSCGFVEPLIPGFLDAGIDCLQTLEVKAGMDPIRICRQYGDRLSIMGGIDVRAISSNDFATIDAELIKKVTVLKQSYGFCLHSDHSIPSDVEYGSYRYFLEKGLVLGKY